MIKIWGIPSFRQTHISRSFARFCNLIRMVCIYIYYDCPRISASRSVPGCWPGHRQVERGTMGRYMTRVSTCTACLWKTLNCTDIMYYYFCKWSYTSVNYVWQMVIYFCTNVFTNTQMLDGALWMSPAGSEIRVTPWVPWFIIRSPEGNPMGIMVETTKSHEIPWQFWNLPHLEGFRWFHASSLCKNTCINLKSDRRRLVLIYNPQLSRS